MSDAYLPGLKVSEQTKIRKTRRLPLKGDVLVQVGQRVESESIVARTHVPGRPHLVNVANQLNIDPGDINESMLKAPGESVKKGEVIARYRAFFGLFKGESTSPASGILEHVSDVTGQVTIREPALPVAVKAYIPGTVKELLPEEGVVIETRAALVQGIFGVGGEGSGILKMAARRPTDTLDQHKISPQDRGKILVGGALVTGEALKKAEECGVAGIVCGGILDSDLHTLLGYEIGVAITGHEDINLSLVVTEGFGKIPMAEKTFTLLKALEGRTASINGSTQIRAGVLRPEVVVARDDIPDAAEAEIGALQIGTQVRIIRTPWFGRLGKVSQLPVELTKIDTESHVRVLEVTLPEGKKVVVPRANVEIIGD